MAQRVASKKKAAAKKRTSRQSAPLKRQWPADRVERRAVESLAPYARNARIHSDEQVAQLAASMDQWGWTTPVLVDERGMIIAGHGRVMAARRLGYAEVPVMVAEGWTDEQKRAYVIADNKLTLNGEWDDRLLSVEFEALGNTDFDLSLTGFGADEIGALMPDEDSEGPGDSQPADMYGGATALTRGSAPMRYWEKAGLLNGEVLDFGCGQDEHDYYRYDMHTEPDVAPLLHRYDTVMCNYVLNVQPSDHLIDMLLALLHHLVADEGRVLIAVVAESQSSYKAACGFRESKPPKEWAHLIGRFFSVAKAEQASFCGFICERDHGPSIT